jgi:hypothetical protein
MGSTYIIEGHVTNNLKHAEYIKLLKGLIAILDNLSKKAPLKGGLNLGRNAPILLQVQNKTIHTPQILSIKSFQLQTNRLNLIQL